MNAFKKQTENVFTIVSDCGKRVEISNTASTGCPSHLSSAFQ